MVSWRPGWQELIIILIILIFVFGAKRLKDIAKGTGEAIQEFKKASEGVHKKEDEEAVIEAAKKMGIETRGKDLKQLVKEMNEKVEESN